jgi:hypothetical protein
VARLPVALPCFVVKSRLSRARRLSVFLQLRHLRKRGETDCKGTTNFSISPNFFEKTFKKFFNNLLKTFVFDLRNSPKAALFSSKAGAKVRTFFKPPNFLATFFQKK